MRWFVDSRTWMWGLLLVSPLAALSDEIEVYIPDVPDYRWVGGCTGTAAGMIMGYWDRHGFPNFYTGPTAGGVAPLNGRGDTQGISAMWVSQAGVDGRPADKPGHQEDYNGDYHAGDFEAFEGSDTDPYRVAGRREHLPDCIGDFIGLSQKKWTNLNDECDGNINNYAFVFWDKSGNKRINFEPPHQNGAPVREIPSGLRLWTKWRGYKADAFSQLMDFNPTVSPGRGFSFEDLKAEINAGHPFMVYEQPYHVYSRSLTNSMIMPRGNPPIHSMVALGYYEAEDGTKWARLHSGWGDGVNYVPWDKSNWVVGMPARGVVGYRPLPKITNVIRENGQVTLTWHGPAGQLVCSTNFVETTRNIHAYVVERSSSLQPESFVPLTVPSFEHSATVPEEGGKTVFYRVRLVTQ